eukprot:Partr_v1_DN28293_c0_g1_i3_m75170
MKILPLALLAHVQLCVWARSPSSPAPPGNGERIKDTEITATHLVSLNQKLQPVLSDLMQVEFFRYFKMDLNKHCPFWDEHGMCHMEQCAVSPILEDDYVDQMWKDQDLGAIQYQRVSPTHSTALKHPSLIACRNRRSKRNATSPTWISACVTTN